MCGILRQLIGADDWFPRHELSEQFSARVRDVQIVVAAANDEARVRCSAFIDPNASRETASNRH
jgi:hypothetical protein